MSLSYSAARISLAVKYLASAPIDCVQRIAELKEMRRSAAIVEHWPKTAETPASAVDSAPDSENPLLAHFKSVKAGRGVWKWLHYFEIYHRHLQKFRDRPITLVEIGVYSGGSLEMWQRYFGPGCHIHGVDIEESCRTYDNATTKIHIGDQASRAFWEQFKLDVTTVDVLIDDGGHSPEQQMVTLEEMLTHMRPGGVYICEDVHGVSNEFAAFAHSLADRLNAFTYVPYVNGLRSEVTPYQAAIHSIHFYPYMVVIEKGDAARTLEAPKHGTQWQPFKI